MNKGAIAPAENEGAAVKPAKDSKEDSAEPQSVKDYRSPPTASLTADYFPLQPGTQLKYTTVHIIKDMASADVQTQTFHNGGNVSYEFSPHMLVFRVGDQEHAEPAECKLPGGSESYRVTSEFVEHDNNGGWEPLLKLGARKGRQVGA